MNFRTTTLAAALVAVLAAPGAQALSLSLDPTVQSVTVGSSVMVDLLYDFSADPTIGGGVDLFYDDSILQFVGFTFDAGFPDDSGLRNLINVLPGELNGLGFGEFNGLSGPGVVGTYTFTALAVGSSTLVLAENDSPVGGFFSATSFDPQDVDFGTASVTVRAAVVPEPGALALLGLGLFGLAVARRRA